MTRRTADGVGDGAISVLSDISTLTVGRRRRPPVDATHMFTVVAIVVIAALATWAIIVVLGSLVDNGAESDQTGPSTGEPAPVPVSRGEPIRVAPPSPSPTPSPPTAKQPNPNSGSGRWNPRTSPSRSGSKPEIGVTRTPVTRAPISVAPKPRQVPENNSATPGDAPKRRGWHW